MQQNIAGRISPNVSRKSGAAAAVPSSSSKKDSTHIAGAKTSYTMLRYYTAVHCTAVSSNKCIISPPVCLLQPKSFSSLLPLQCLPHQGTARAGHSHSPVARGLSHSHLAGESAPHQRCHRPRCRIEWAVGPSMQGGRGKHRKDRGRVSIPRLHPPQPPQR